MIGKIVSRYKIIEKLGSGGMGVVFKAQDTKLDRFVALKFLPQHLGQTEEQEKRFIQEAKAASALNHPNIATIYEIDEADGQMFIAMECVAGQDLVSAIRESPLPFDRALNYAIQIAEGLSKAHSQGIVHRDIKPANILINEDKTVKIVDFGLAKLTGQTMLTKEGTTLGTVAYMSPEQTQGGDLDHRADIWALGTVIYEMITGRPPFRGDYEQAVIYSIMNENPEPPTALRTGIPTELERIILKTLAKEPGERYQRVDELVVDLKKVEKESKTSKPRLSTPSESSPSKKWPFLIGGIFVLFVVAMISLILLKSDAIDGKSIAVLPFENLSADEGNEYFSDGVTDDIISQLSKISDLRVISRTSIMRYKNSEKSIKEIGRELDVATILEGSVRREGNQVRIVSQLIDSRNDENLWSETYDRELIEIFAIQSDVAHQIAGALKARLLPKEEQLIDRTPTDNLEAYSLYQKSRHHFLNYTIDDFKQGIELARQAIELDPNYALAYSALAEAYYRATSHLLPSYETMPKAKEAALSALQIDESVARAHMALAVVLYRYEFEWNSADEHFKRALVLSPHDATIREEFGAYFLMSQGHFDEALNQLNHALKLDPYSPIIKGKLAFLYYYQRDYERALDLSEQAIRSHPDFANNYLFRGMAYGALGQHSEAIDDLEGLLQTGFASDIAYPYLAHAYLESGDEMKAEEILKILEERVTERTDLTYYLARIYSFMGQTDIAFKWLSEAYRKRSELIMFLKLDPPFDKIRSDPRFNEMLEKIGLTP